jgi:hypothetical protein
MRKKLVGEVVRLKSRERPSLTAHLETVRYLAKIKSPFGVRPTSPFQQIAEALIEAGYKSLDAQAKALGIHRSTAWTIIKSRHKLGRLNTKTTQQILANPETPPAVRAVVEKYLAEGQKFWCSAKQR